MANRMVNLSCRQCGMSLDTDVDHLFDYCPECGGEMYISVHKAMDIRDEKKMSKRKDIKYVNTVYTVPNGNEKKPEKKKLDIYTIMSIAFFVAMVTMVILWYYFIVGFNM